MQTACAREASGRQQRRRQRRASCCLPAPSGTPAPALQLHCTARPRPHASKCADRTAKAQLLQLAAACAHCQPLSRLPPTPAAAAAPTPHVQVRLGARVDVVVRIAAQLAQRRRQRGLLLLPAPAGTRRVRAARGSGQGVQAGRQSVAVLVQTVLQRLQLCRSRCAGLLLAAAAGPDRLPAGKQTPQAAAGTAAAGQPANPTPPAAVMAAGHRHRRGQRPPPAAGASSAGSQPPSRSHARRPAKPEALVLQHNQPVVLTPGAAPSGPPPPPARGWSPGPAGWPPHASASCFQGPPQLQESGDCGNARAFGEPGTGGSRSHLRRLRAPCVHADRVATFHNVVCIGI